MMAELQWETSPASTPLPEGFPTLKEPTMAAPSIHSRTLRFHEHKIHTGKIAFAAGNGEILQSVKRHILDAHALRWEMASDGVVPILSADDRTVLDLPLDGGEYSFAA